MTVHKKEGDALLGDRIAVKARRIGKTRLIEDTSAHRCQSTKLRGSAYCVIESPLRSVRERKI